MSIRACVLAVLLTPLKLAVDLITALTLMPAMVLIESEQPYPFTPALWRWLTAV